MLRTMNPKLKNLIVRALSGAVYVALMLVGVLWPILMAGLMAIVAIIGISEYSRLTSGPVDGFSDSVLSIFVFFYFGLTMFLFANYYVLVPFILCAGFVAMLFLYALVMMVAELFRKRPCPIEQIGKGVFGMLWIVLPLVMLTILTNIYPQLTLAFLLLLWGNDTFAYLGGSLYGRHKMFERISPKKTWEGTLTGAVVAVLMAVMFMRIPFFSCHNCLHTTVQWCLFAFITVVFGTLGDLLESLFKRNAGVKDSGHIMPGHGGILDRFDSILMAIVPVFLYVAFMVLIG